MIFQISLILFTAISVLFILINKFKIHSFYVLLILAMALGLYTTQNITETLHLIKAGMGTTIEKVGLLVVLGTFLGFILEQSGATQSIATFITSRLGQNKTGLAIAIIGFCVGLPIFCDSAFIVLNGVLLSLSAKQPEKHGFYSSLLGTVLLAVHCMVPPHPGIAAAAVTLQANMAKALVFNILLSVPACVIAYFATKYLSIKTENHASLLHFEPDTAHKNLPDIFSSILPIIVPLLCIALGTVSGMNKSTPTAGLSLISWLSEPSLALTIGIILALFLFKDKLQYINQIANDSIEKSGPILLIIAAGGAFGAAIKSMNIGQIYGPWLASSGLGLLVPFALSGLFKTAQGSSTVAAISASAIVLPLLGNLGLASEWGKVLSLAAIGAGSMFFSHANDAYYWVVSRFAKLETTQMNQMYTPLTAMMGLTTLLCLYIAQYFLL